VNKPWITAIQLRINPGKFTIFKTDALMPVAGYSGTPLLKKLGIKEGWKMRLIGAPADYFDLLEADLSGQVCMAREVPDFVHLFAATHKDFEKEMPAVLRAAARNPQLVVWVSWYKKSSGKATDLTETLIRNYALANGLVDIKVCAVSEDWSGLKLVVPVKKR
jgi:hypothetical protein